MSNANLIETTWVRETTLGVTPGSPRMRKMRYVRGGPRWNPAFGASEEKRDDRMNIAPFKSNETTEGQQVLEFSYPVDDSPLSDIYASAFYNDWVKTAQRFNDGVADSVITDVAATGGVITVATGTAFVAGDLVHNTGFGQANNNGLFLCTTGSATVPAFASQGLVNEAAPAAAARAKTVGFQGAAGDLVAVSDGITSTALDFTTLTSLAVGKWLKIGGTGAAFRFANVAANNGWARITAIAAGKLTLDNLPAGWGADDGAGKTIRVFVGDYIRNGTTQISGTIQQRHKDQVTPTCLKHRGNIAGTLEWQIQSDSNRPIGMTVGWTGMASTQDTSNLDASPDAPSPGEVMAPNVNVGRIAAHGSRLTSPNWVQQVTIRINNNMRRRTAVDELGAVDLGEGDFTVTADTQTYFGDNTLLTRFVDGDLTSLNARVQKDGQAVVFTIPSFTYTGGAPDDPGKNQDTFLPLTGMASVDALTSCHMQADRFEYYEA